MYFIGFIKYCNAQTSYTSNSTAGTVTQIQRVQKQRGNIPNRTYDALRTMLFNSPVVMHFRNRLVTANAEPILPVDNAAGCTSLVSITLLNSN
jgi:hypothetical protein